MTDSPVLTQLKALRDEAVQRAVRSSAEVAILDRAIASLQGDSYESKAARNSLAGAGPDDFRFMLIVDALQKHLSRIGRSIPVNEELLATLNAGGARTRTGALLSTRILKTTIRMNSQKSDHPFVYDHRLLTVGLRAWQRQANHQGAAGGSDD